MTFTDFLQSLQTSAGINVVVGFILSFLAESVPQYGSLSAAWKRGIMMALCFVLPVAATVLLGCYDAECVWSALLAGGSAFFGSQVAHARKL